MESCIEEAWSKRLHPLVVHPLQLHVLKSDFPHKAVGISKRYSYCTTITVVVRKLSRS